MMYEDGGNEELLRDTSKLETASDEAVTRGNARVTITSASLSARGWGRTSAGDVGSKHHQRPPEALSWMEREAQNRLMKPYATGLVRYQVIYSGHCS